MPEQLKKSQRISNQNNETDNADDIDFARYFNLLLESKYLIASVTGVFAVAGVIFALLQTPIYKADALVQIEEKSSGIPGLGDMEDVFGAESKSITEIELLKSRKVLGNTVDFLKLDVVATPKYYRKFGPYFARTYHGPKDGTAFNTPWIASLFDDSYAWGGETINVAQLQVSPNLLGAGLELVAQGNNSYKLYLGETLLLEGQTNEIAKSANGSVELLVTDLIAEQGTAFIVKKNYRSDVIAGLQQQLQVAEKGKQSGILVLSLESADRIQAEKTLNAIADAFLLQNVQRMSAEVEKSIEFLNEELPKIDNKQIAAENTLNDFRLQNDSVDLTMETESVLEQMVAIDTELHELSFLEVDISQRYTKEHPRYLSLITKQKELAKQKADLNESVKSLPKTQQKILRMARDVEVNQQIYLALLNKVQELNVVRASTVGSINIVDYAQAGRFPIKPKKSLIVVIITMLGGFLAVAFVILKAAFHRGVTNPQEFEDVGLTVYATVPLSEEHVKRTQVSKLKDKVQRNKRSKQSIELLAQVNPSDMTIEALRSLRTSLHFAMLEAKNNVVMISGASPEVGKSFISTNLATVVAQAGQKVLIIDGDMRKGYMQKVFNLKAENGLSDHLIGDISHDQAIQETVIENLSIVTRGQIPPNPSELLMSEGFTNFINKVANDFDLVIIDTPPILAVTDAAIIGRHVGTALMLARYNMSPLKEIITAVNRFDLNGVEIKGLIFNAVEKRNSDYGYYNYGYEYK